MEDYEIDYELKKLNDIVFKIIGQYNLSKEEALTAALQLRKNFILEDITFNLMELRITLGEVKIILENRTNDY